ncbi:MAG: rRNA adenine methyltransferase [Halobacteriovorax sp.]|nr:rRNA adenine methyltransferase [Halobacteriovorax sp.]
MSEIDDGVIKYQRVFTPADALEHHEYRDLESWRKKLFQLKLIGEYPSVCIGYGNMSQRLEPSLPIQFIITGTQTGKFEELNGEHYTTVTGYNLENNMIEAKGCIDASSEALTHAALYEVHPEIKAVFHIHDKVIWQSMLDGDFLYTKKDIPYGTVEMARAVQEIVKTKNSGVFAMAGHDDGVVAWGSSLDEAGVEIMKLVKLFKT